MSGAGAQTTDSLIIGAGVIGLTIARELKNRFPEQKITILEKEPDLGVHSSGRNSGVLHSGIYYPQGSLKARLCAEGARAMAAYCEEKGLPVDRRGKVVVPTREGDDAQLDLLLSRARANGARAELVDANQLRELEPEARTPSGRALYTPDTSVVDPKRILRAMADDLQKQGVEIRFNAKVFGINPQNSTARAGADRISYGHLFNTAGLHADHVARPFGVGTHLKILPFKGLYYKLAPESGLRVNHLIYPVPDLKVPFLGVHFTTSIDGTVYLGPTAVPAFGRENYRGFQSVDATDTPAILFRLAQQYALNRQGFRRFAHSEGMRFFRSRFAEAARGLVPALKTEHLLPCDKVGIRPQLLDLEKKELVMDFLVERKGNSTHVLNAISPAFTCSIGFSKLVLDQYYA